MLKIVRAALFVVAASPILVAAVTASGAVVSTFGTDNEGWTTFQNVGASVQYISTGGNPDGHIGATDKTADWAYVQAPSKFLVPAEYNGTLSFDLKAINTVFPVLYNVRVGLQGGAGLTLISESSVPTAGWLNYSFLLNESSGWRIFSNLSQNYSSLAPTPTQSEMQSVLASLTRIVIATDYSDAFLDGTSGIDSAYLDNVRLSTSEVPVPAALPLFASALIGGGVIAWRKRRKQKAEPLAA
jgi:hypothetical protein